MPIKYIPFIPEPVEGQAVLGNFNRILRYKGAGEPATTSPGGRPPERDGGAGGRERKTGDTRALGGGGGACCAYLKEQGVQVDLVYIDPPFASGADYAKKVYIRRNPKVAEAIV